MIDRRRPLNCTPENPRFSLCIVSRGSVHRLDTDSSLSRHGRTTPRADGRRPEASAKKSADETRRPRRARAVSQLLANYWRAGDGDSRHGHSTKARQPAQAQPGATSEASRRVSRRVEPRQAARTGKLAAPGIERSPSTSSASCKTKRAESRSRLEGGATRCKQDGSAVNRCEHRKTISTVV